MRKLLVALLAVFTMMPLALHADALRDSIMQAMLSIEDDSIRLRHMFICAQNNMDEMWALELLDSGRNDAARQHHVQWELSYMGSKVRWAHRHHDWESMDRFLKEQREASFKYHMIGNYMSQIAQSVIVLSGVGLYEQAWKYIEQIRRDIKEGGEEGEKNRAYIYLAEANYYEARGEQEKCRDTYIRALQSCPDVSSSQRLAIHNGLIRVYTELEAYEKALEHADSMIAIYYTFSEDHQRVPNSRAMLVECELHKAELYMRLWEFNKMRQCLERAEAKVEGTPSNLYGDLYYWWHRYYFMVSDYEKSLEYLDIAAESLRKDQYYEQAMQRELDKAMCIWAQGKYDEALQLYTTKLIELDTLHQSMIDKQHDYLAQLNEMLQEEEASINMQLWASRILSIVAFVVFLIIMGCVIYSLYSRRTLKHNHQVALLKLKEARDSDEAKERFLHDITTLINDPLQCVVSDAKRLVNDNSLSPEELQTVMRNNKAHVERLMTLVNNVLDLSRLEAGMMKYSTTDCELLTVLNDTVRSHSSRNPDIPIEIKSEIAQFPLTIDVGRFSNMLRTLFLAPVDHQEWKSRCIILQLRRGGNNSVMLVIMGTRYSHNDITEAEEMTHRINRMFMKDFGATYTVGYGAITIVFPANNK